MLFGGWIDFMPGIRESPEPKNSGTCFFTSFADGNRLTAIVESASLDNPANMSRGQETFVRAVFEAFKVPYADYSHQKYLALPPAK